MTIFRFDRQTGTLAWPGGGAPMRALDPGDGWCNAPGDLRRLVAAARHGDFLDIR